MMNLTCSEDFSSEAAKALLLGSVPTLTNSTIRIEGADNILFCEEGVHLEDSTISFFGSNSLIYLSRSKHAYKLDIDIYNNSVIHFGCDNYMNDPVRMILSEQKHMFIGSGCLFAQEICMRNADPHLIYDIDSKQRINPTKSIFVGDHVWIGQRAMLLKGTRIHSGSIIGAMSLVSGKRIPSCEVWGGNPARKIKANVFWKDQCVHTWRQEQTDYYREDTSTTYVYKSDSHTVDFAFLEEKLCEDTSAALKCSWLTEFNQSPAKNRFAQRTIPVPITKKIKHKLKKIAGRT